MENQEMPTCNARMLVTDSRDLERTADNTMTFDESNPEVRPAGEEAREYADDGPRTRDPAAATDPTRPPTGSPPLAPAPTATDASREPGDDPTD
jgi:hypothetical protein